MANPCIRCGGPKSAGQGRRLCDRCRPAKPPGHGCLRCLAYKPRDAFEQAGANGRRRMDTVCLACRETERKEREEREAQREANRSTVTLPPRPLVSAWFPAPMGFEPGATWRRCSCRTHVGQRWLPLLAFPISKAYVTGAGRYAYHCRPCIAARANARDKVLRNDPERAAEYREKRNATQREWRHRNPEKGREYERRYKERLRADPDRYAAYIADQRITYKLRRERNGLPIGHGQRNATARFVSSAGRSRKGLSPEPLVLWLERVLQTDHRSIEEIAAVMQVDSSTLPRVLRREYETVTEGSADALVWGYGRPVKMPGDGEIAALLAARCQDMPGNGTRLLRYLDIGEQVAHLADVVVDRIEDLWPELEPAG